MLFKDYLDKYQIDYKTDFPTARISSIKAGGYSKYLLYPKSPKELILIIRLCKVFSVQFKIIGGCTNTFVCDEGYRGALILTKHLSQIICSDGKFIAEAGASLNALLKTALSLEFEIKNELFGIPGSIGGAVRNNAGAFGAEISDAFESGLFYDIDNDITVNLTEKDLCFAYRYSILQSENYVLLRGKFKGIKSSPEAISASFSEYSRKRRASQPSTPSLGSFFKRSGEIIPARLIDRAGLKGKTVGGAEVSTKHAGFIINGNAATATDIDTLAKEIESIIFERYNVSLIREVEMIK